MTHSIAPFLLIDIGNSRTKWGLASDGWIDSGEPFATQDLIDNNESLLCVWQNAPKPAQVLVANVAGLECANCLAATTLRYWSLAPRFVRSEASGFGIRNAYLKPTKLGIDRWVALIGARHSCRAPVCVADCGTAITMDALDAEGNHLGGVIAPGLAMMRESLKSGTHELPMAGGQFVESFARETSAAITSGTFQAAAGLIERCFRETAVKLASEPRLLLTGGDAPAIAPLLGVPFDLRPELVLEGLLVIAESGQQYPLGHFR